MNKPIQYEASYLYCGIMCAEECGNTLEAYIRSCLKQCNTKERPLPADATLTIDLEPHDSGVNRVIVTIKSTQALSAQFHSEFDEKIKTQVPFDPPQESSHTQQKSQKINIYNIAINLFSTALIVLLILTLPSSIILTATLTAISLCTTAFTAREYLFSFFSNLRAKQPFTMNSTISLGWLLSCAHTLFHAIMMPMGGSFSMMFMNFIMPTILILCINSMDEIKRRLINKATQQQLQGIRSLFPTLSESYQSYFLSNDQQLLIKSPDITTNTITELLSEINLTPERKNNLQKGTLIKINQDECIPVDCILVGKEAIVDESLLTGEPQQYKQHGEEIKAGAINRSSTIFVLASEDSYHSTISRLIMRSNRLGTSPPHSTAAKTTPFFVYFYSGLIATSLITAIVAPVLLGIATLPLIIQNVIGVLFSICPCTIAIAHDLPKLLHNYYLTKQNIHVRQKETLGDIDTFHTFVFDKTGTLTTNNSIVDSYTSSIDSALWQRIYLLEQAYGNQHPIAKAIMNHYEAHRTSSTLFNQTDDYIPDPQHRGLSAQVQGKKIHLGNAQYFTANRISLPLIANNTNNSGLSPIYVAEEKEYKGVIYIKHEARAGIIETLRELKKTKTIIMLTGDNIESARAFNQQIGPIFADDKIHAGQTPQQKEDFFQKIANSNEIKPHGKKLHGICFIGDGLNDAPCCKLVSEEGGLSCSIENKDKSIFFTDVCLNGSLDYLFQHQSLKKSLRHNIMQNQGALAYSTFVSLAFIIAFSIAGISVPAIIPMCIMIATTLFVFANAHRLKGVISAHLEKNNSWLTRFATSPYAVYIPLIGSTLLVASAISATLATGAFALPLFIFNSGLLMAASSICSQIALICAGLTALLAATSICPPKPQLSPSSAERLERAIPMESEKPVVDENQSSHSAISFFATPTTKPIAQSYPLAPSDQPSLINSAPQGVNI